MNKSGITIVYLGKVPREFGVESVGYAPRDEQIAADKQPRKGLRQYAWIALTRAIAEYTETNGCTMPLPRLLPNGKWVADNCYLSLSHTDGYVAAAVSDLPVGVDIERTDRKLAKGLYDRIVCGKEKALYAAPDNTQLLQLWTAKEAFLKAIGTGIDAKASSYDFSKSNTISLDDGSFWKLEHHTVYDFPDYLSCVCYKCLQ